MNLGRGVAVASLAAAALLGVAASALRQSNSAAGDGSPPRVPKNRTRLDVNVFDGHHSPPSAAIRSGFDGVWKGGAGEIGVEILLLDGVGDCKLTAGDGGGEWAIEIIEYFGDDLFDLALWNRDETVLCTASYLEDDDDAIRVWRAVPSVKGMPQTPFVLRRVRGSKR